ncbi:hypothetical protein IG631_01351 [Alternaria alternata]|nr:hypothetical protein IG631_01351 [Alternaria alternata]
MYFHIIPRPTCLLHVTRIGDMPHPLLYGTCDMQSRSCLMHPAYQELACCRLKASNTPTTADSSACHCIVSDEAHRSACASVCDSWRVHAGYALCEAGRLSS